MQDHISDNLSESQLIQDSINGSRRMQQALYSKFAAKMYQVCLRYTSNTEDAKDNMVYIEGINENTKLTTFKAQILRK